MSLNPSDDLVFQRLKCRELSEGTEIFDEISNTMNVCLRTEVLQPTTGQSAGLFEQTV